ncbi:MAG: hypothetical protein AVDCRST_MAG56-7136 [uncultured Cytophagales bacterium]|uniref:Uncharacterized protein n=1 Tax=uncultured Cytophagales bacterium TaxID=158755 RepID=A0A6J4L918_9SPHI|nr:MAG: hypothetical protein AVDCRST_MAG56-7136 [uncultured Cytophagales bacterium]
MRHLVQYSCYGIFCFLLVSVFRPVPSRAQELTLRTDGKSRLQVVSADNDAFVTVSTTDLPNNTSRAGFTFYDGTFREGQKLNLSIPLQSVLTSHDYNGFHHLFVFKSKIGDNGSAVILNKNGIITAQHSFTSQSFAKPPVVLAQRGDPAFYRLDYLDQRGGLAFGKLDSTGRSLWKRNFVADEKGEIGQMQLLGNLLLFTTRAKVTSRKVSVRLVGISRENGQVLFDKPLADEQLVTDPTAFGLSGDTLLVAGSFFREGQMRTKDCDGIFLAAFNQQGAPLFRQLYDWETVIGPAYRKSGINCDLRAVVCQQIVPARDGFRVLVETFDKVANGVDFANNAALGVLELMSGLPLPYVNSQLSTFRVQDMFVFNAGPAGNLTGIGRVEKLPSYKAIRNDYVGMTSPHFMRAGGVFDHHFTLQPAGGAAPYGFIKENVKENQRIGVFRFTGDNTLPVQSYYLANLGVTEKVKSFDFVYGSETAVLVLYRVKKDLHFRKVALSNFQ